MTTAQRSSTMPEVPTIADAGGALVGFDIDTWFGRFGPARLPADATQRLNRAFVDAPATPELRTRPATLMAEPMPMSPDRFAAFVRREHARCEAVVKRSGTRIEC